jgi:sigma-B regulation protein RsbU (phosphoserine phosphatase)
VVEHEGTAEAFDRALLADDAQSLFDRAPCGYLSTTPDGTIVKVNDTFLTWTGHTRSALVGRRTFVSLLSAGGRIYHDTHYAPLLRMHGAVREIALDLVKADGDRLPVLVNAALTRDAGGEPVVIRVVLFDATERRLYERELLREKRRAEESEARARALAQTLQQTLIPPHPPRIPGLDVAAAYRPAGNGEEVGGDFYDVFQIGEDDWVVALGDVCGKGVDAAILTSLVRHTLRAVTVQLPSPADALRALNEVLLRRQMDRFSTVALLRLRRAAGRWQLTLSLGGHPQPLVLGGDGSAGRLGEPGTLVGVLDKPEFHETRFPLHSGDTVVLYTDGVTEGRRGAEFYGDDRLRAVAAVHASTPSGVVDAILADVLEFQGGRARDDIAILALGPLERRVGRAGSSPSSRAGSRSLARR